MIDAAILCCFDHQQVHLPSSISFCYLFKSNLFLFLLLVSQLLGPTKIPSFLLFTTFPRINLNLFHSSEQMNLLKKEVIQKYPPLLSTLTSCSHILLSASNVSSSLQFPRREHSSVAKPSIGFLFHSSVGIRFGCK